MKKLLVVLIILVASVSAAVCIYGVTATGIFAAEKLKGSGNIVSKTIDAPDFHAIDASRAVKVIISDKLSDKITIAADDNVVDLVEVKTTKGRLIVSIDSSVKSISNLDVTVTVPANGRIRSLQASSASKIVCQTALGAEKFTMSASSAASIEAAVKADKCAIDASSASRIEAALDVVSCSIDLSSAANADISGSAQQCTADMSSASKLSAGRFAVVNLAVDTSSAAKAVVHCTGMLRAQASSGSSIRYSGDCNTEIEKSSGGSVHKN